MLGKAPASTTTWKIAVALGGVLSDDVRFGPDFVRFAPKSGHSEAHAGLPFVTRLGHLVW